MGLRAALVDRARVVSRVGQGVFLPVPPDVTVRVSRNGAVTVGSYVYGVSALTADGGETPVGETPQAVVPIVGGVRVRWSAVIGAAGYRVYRGLDTASLQLLWEIDDGQAETFYDDGSKVVNPAIAPPDASSARGRASGSYAYSTVSGDWFLARIQLPASPETADPSGRRRTSTTPTLMYGVKDSAGQPVVLSPEDRLEVDSPTQFEEGQTQQYDVVGLPEPMRKKRQVIGWTVTLKRVVQAQAEVAA